MKWETKFKKALEAIEPPFKEMMAEFSAEDMEEVSRRAERDWDPPRKTAERALGEAIVHVDFARWARAHPEEYYAMSGRRRV